MANIGTFARAEDGSFNGVIKTLNLNEKVRLVPIDAIGKGPNFRIFAKGYVELGAAWHKVSKEDRSYLSVKLDDPSLPAPIYASLHEDENGEYSLIWSRPTVQ